MSKYLPATIDQCVLPPHVRKRFEGLINRGDRLPNMIFYAQCVEEPLTVALALAASMDYDAVGFSTALVPKTSHKYIDRSRHDRAARAGQEHGLEHLVPKKHEKALLHMGSLLNTVNIETLQRRLLIMIKPSGIRKIAGDIADAISNARLGSTIIITDAPEKLPPELRNSLPRLGFDFALNHSEASKASVIQQCKGIMERQGVNLPEEQLIEKIHANYPRWVSLANNDDLAEFKFLDFRKPKFSKNALQNRITT